MSGDGRDSVPRFRCQVSEKRNIEPETCIHTETLALVICDLEFLFLQYFSTPKRLAIPTDKECIQPQSAIYNHKS